MKRILLATLLLTALASPVRSGVTVLGGLTHEFTLQPGESVGGSIQLNNDTDSIAVVTLFQSDYMFFADGQTEYSEPGTIQRSNADWISIGPVRATIPPGETAPIYYEIEIPAGMELSGTYWSVIMIEPDAAAGMQRLQSSNDRSVLALKTVVRYALQVIVNIGETGSSDVRVARTELADDGGRRILVSDIENTGERWMRPMFWVELYDEQGKLTGRYESQRQRIFPGCSVRHMLDLSEVPSGQYSALMIVDDGDELVFGANYRMRL